MFDAATAMRPALIARLRELGHREHYILKLSIQQMRAIAAAEKRFEPTPDYTPDYSPAPTMPATAEPVSTPIRDVISTNPTPGKAGAVGALVDAIAADMAETVGNILRPEFRAMMEGKASEITLTINLGDDVTKVDLGIAHTLQATLIKLLVSKVNVYLHGPAGSGKTTAARKAAKAISAILGREIPFYAFSCDETMQTFALLGYRSAKDDQVVRTQFRDAWENGGVLLLDELDTAPGLITVLNMALDSDQCAFPDGLITRHEDFYFVGGGNTVGKGATTEYVARNRQDAATMNRFFMLAWHYDEALELAAAGVDQSAWVKHVQKLRAAVKALGVSAPELLITPRASIYGARILRANTATTFADLEEGLIWQGCSEDDKAKVRAKVGR